MFWSGGPVEQGCIITEDYNQEGVAQGWAQGLIVYKE
jgi:hypothetical protein